jgi:hypothetical protein
MGGADLRRYRRHAGALGDDHLHPHQHRAFFERSGRSADA